MKLLKTCVSAAFALTLVCAVPAFAQHRGDRSSRNSSHGVTRGSASRSFNGGRSYAAPHVLGGVRAVQAPRSAFAVRSYAAPRAVAVRSYAAPRVIGPVRAFAAPYYAFRPRTTLTFGLAVGYPVAYPYSYAPGYVDSYAYSYPYANVYPAPYASGAVAPAPYVTPFPTASSPDAFGESGGLSFEIAPGDAQVLIDGQLVGIVSSFSSTSQPLTLPPGHHHLEIRASGYRSVVDDVDIVPGEIVPFHGKLQR